MAIKKRIKKLSKLTRELLAEGESARADFKKIPKGISADDIVAFANSDVGGQILLGVDEQVVDKTQIGVVHGCDVSDGTVLEILNKAVSCIPPVSIDIYIENLDDKPILRVEVPPSQTKPHCTPKGVYCRRDGARNRPLHPSELLKLFLESEATAFAKRFGAAAERITNELTSLESSLDSSINKMADQLGWAGYQLGDTESTLDGIQGLVGKLTLDTEKINSRLRELFRQDDREDPVRKNARLQVFNQLIRKIEEDEKIFAHVVSGGNLSVQNEQPENSDITNKDIKEVLEIAVRYVHDAERDKNYNIVVKAPKDCSDVELEQFATKLAAEDRGHVTGAAQLGFVIYDDTVIGTAALKKPTKSYRAKVFRNAKSKLDPTAYPYELCWIFLEVTHYKKGQMTRLITDLLPAAKGSGLISIARASADDMQDMLVQLEFSMDGTEYQSEQNPKDAVKLFVLAAPEGETSESAT